MDCRRLPSGERGGAEVRLTQEEMVDAAEDLATIIEANLLPVFSAERVRRLRESPTLGLPAPWRTQVEADYIAGIASKCLGGSARQWREAALAALGCRDSGQVSIEVLRELAERARDEQEEREERCSPATRRSREPADEPPETDRPIRSTIGSRHRKRGTR